MKKLNKILDYAIKQNSEYLVSIYCISIINPIKKVQLKIVQFEGFDDIKYIENPDERLYIEIIKNNLKAICYIKFNNQTQEMLNYLFENYEKIAKNVWKFIKNIYKNRI